MFKHTAQQYLACGLSVFPATSAKKPAIPAWVPYQTRIPSAEEVEIWSKDLGDQNIAIVCGQLSNLTVVDCDTPEAIQGVEALLPEGMELPIVTTPRAGRHYYFRYCPELHSRNNAHDGIDIKSEGGYVLAPPSRTKSGAYSWHLELNLSTVAERPPVPEALLKLLKAGTTSPVLPSPDKPILTQGTRDQDLFHAAYGFFNNERPRDEVERIIVNMAKVCTPPFPEREARAKVESAWKRYQSSAAANTTDKEVPKRKLQQTNIRVFSAIPKIPIQWLWPGRFPLGMFSLIAGQQGQGKSTFTTWMACRLSRGDFWPDGPGLDRPVDTLIITSEDPAEQVIKYRIEAGGGDDSHIFQMDSVLNKGEVFPFDFNKHLPELENNLTENPNIKFTVIDPLASHMGAELDASDMNRVRWSLSGLATCAKKFNICIIGIGHFKKNEDVDEVLNKIAGSYQFSSLPRAVWMIMEDKHGQDEHKRKFFLPGKINPCQPRGGFSFYIETVLIDGQETGKIIIEPEKSKYSTANELHARNRDTRLLKIEGIEAFITDYLTDGPRRSHEDLDEALTAAGYSPRTADPVKTKMKQAGNINFRKEDGIYWIFLTSKPGRFGPR